MSENSPTHSGHSATQKARLQMIQLIQQSELANHASRKLLKLLNHFTARPTLFTKKRTAATVW